MTWNRLVGASGEECKPGQPLDDDWDMETAKMDMDMDMTGGGMECQDDDDDARVGGERSDVYEMVWNDARTGMGGGGGGTIPNKGTTAFSVSKTISKGMEGGTGKGNVGARRMMGGRGAARNAIEMMMTRKIPERMTKKPLKKQIRGAKSKVRKGKVVKTDSSQPGIERFLYFKKTLIGAIGLDSGIGRENSLGITRKFHKTQ